MTAHDGSAGRDKIHQMVEHFLDLNEKNRQGRLTPTEMDEWYKVKGQIEQALFATPPEASDRRKSIRIRNLDLPVRYDSGIEEGEGRVREISEGGLFVATATPLPAGTTLKLQIIVDDEADNPDSPSEEIQVNAKVLYTQLGHSIGDRSFSGMGLALVGPRNPEIRLRWTRFVEDLLKQAVRG